MPEVFFRSMTGLYSGDTPVCGKAFNFYGQIVNLVRNIFNFSCKSINLGRKVFTSFNLGLL